MSKALLITGATGKQGGAAINALLEADADFQILALTRNAQSASAKSLAGKSERIKIIQGNMERPGEIFEKAKEIVPEGVWGVFSIQQSVGPGASPQAEERQGKALIDAAILNDVKFFVYSSVDRGGDDSTDTPTYVPHFISKHHIEQHLFNATNPATSSNGMSWCVLRPTAFYDNLVPGFMGKLYATWLDIGLKGKKLQIIAVSDIGAFAAKAFMDPEAYKNRKISLAGDELTYDETRKVFKEVTGTELPTTWKWMGSFMMWMIKEVGIMFKWFHDCGYKVDVAALKREYPGLKDFKTWLETESGFVKK